MELIFNTVRNNIEKVKLCTDYDYNFLINEMKGETWQSHGQDFRYYLGQPHSKVLQNILSFLSSNTYRATTNFCEGTCFVNDYDVWHEGYNKSKKDRYLINLGLIVDV